MTKPKIAIVTTYMDRRPAKGTALFIRKWIEELVAYKNEFDITLIHEESIPEDPLYKEFREVVIPRLRLPKYARFFSELWFYLTSREKYDIFYSAYSRLYPTFWLAPGKKFMYVIGDGGPASAGFQVRVKGAVPWWIRIFFWRISAFIALSEFGKKGVLEAYHLPPEKVFVADGAVGKEFIPTKDKAAVQRVMREKYQLPSPYILDVSRFDPHKNIIRMVEAYKILVERDHIPHSLVFVGGRHMKDYSQEVDRRIQELGLAERVTVAPFITDEDMPKVYQAAELLAFPSLYEAFGLPATEAMACGIPVLTATVGGFPWVVGDAGVMVDPYQPEAIAQGIRQILNQSPEERQQMIEKGCERAAGFTWHRSLQGIIDAFHFVLRK